MPKCRVCGKRFDSLSSLREHHRAVHPNARFVPPKTTLSRNLLVGTIIVLVVIGGLVGYLIYSQSLGSSSSGNTGLLNVNISSSLYQNMTGVSYSTLSAIGSSQPSVNNPPKSIGNSVTLTSNGKPEILYIGAEYCPYCAAERWAMVVALLKFGNFSNLEYMLSSSSDVYPNTATLSFRSGNYSSSYNLTFVAVENEDRSKNPLQSTTSEEQQLWNQYTNGQLSYPFVDIGGEYLLTSSQFNPDDLKNLNWTQVGSQLNNPQSLVAKDIDGAANQFIGAICKIDGGSPNSICSQSFATVSFVQQSSTSPLFQFLILPQDESRTLRNPSTRI